MKSENNIFRKKHCPEAEKSNQDGQLPLHLFCQNPNASVDDCRALLEANPSAAHKRDVYGRTPLFYALKRGCPDEVVQLVFEANPDAVTERDFCGETPLFFIYHRSKDPSILKYMLNYRPSLALKRIHSFAGPDLVRLACSPWESYFHKITANQVRGDDELYHQWQKVVLTVSAAHKCRHYDNREQAYELHVALQVPCSPRVLAWFIRMYPQQCKIPMADGKLPLHSFCSSLELVNQKEAKHVLQLLLDAYPDAAIVSFNGKLPLHFAIESGCSWENGLEAVFYAHPEAMQSLDCSTGLYPFMIAAADDQSDLNSLYSLIREGPELLKV